MKQSVLKSLYSFDQFSEPNSLKLNNSHKYQTIGGVIATFTIITVTLVSFVYLMNDMYSRKNPLVNFKTEQVTMVDPVYFGPNNFVIAASVINFATGQVINNSPNKTYYNISFRYVAQELKVVNRQPQYTQKYVDIPSVICNSSKTSPNLIQGIDPTILSIGYCPDYDYWQKLNDTLYGSQQAANFSYFNVRINRCINGTQNVGITYFLNQVCASQNEIDQVLASGTAGVGLVQSDYTADYTKVGNPYEANLKQFTYLLSNNEIQQITNFYKVTQTLTTENFFYYFGHTYTDKTIQFQTSSIKSGQLQTNSTQPLLSVTFFLTQQLDTTYRTYSNILNVFGAVGGLFNTLTLILGLVISPFVQFYHNYDLVNLWFSYQKPSKKSKVHVEKSNTNLDQSYHQSIANLLNKQKQSYVPLNLMEKLMIITDKTKQQTIDKGMKEITKQIDIETYLLMIQDIENLKALLLTEEQRTLMTFIMKPELRNDPDPIIKESYELPDQIEFYQLGSINLVKSYHKISNSEFERKDPITQKLLQMLHPEVLHILDKASESKANKNMKDSIIIPVESGSRSLRDEYIIPQAQVEHDVRDETQLLQQ